MRRVNGRETDRISVGLYRAADGAAVWMFVRLRDRWWGVECRWDPGILGSKAGVRVADHYIGWTE